MSMPKTASRPPADPRILPVQGKRNCCSGDRSSRFALRRILRAYGARSLSCVQRSVFVTSLESRMAMARFLHETYPDALDRLSTFRSAQAGSNWLRRRAGHGRSAATSNLDAGRTPVTLAPALRCSARPNSLVRTVPRVLFSLLRIPPFQITFSATNGS